MALTASAILAQFATVVAVMPIHGVNVEPDLVEALQSRLESRLASDDDLSLVERTRLAEILEIQSFSLLECGIDCGGEIGSLVGADLAIVGRLQRQGRTLGLRLTLVDVSEMELKATSYQTTQREDIDAFELAEYAAADLFGMDYDLVDYGPYSVPLNCVPLASAAISELQDAAAREFGLPPVIRCNDIVGPMVLIAPGRRYVGIDIDDRASFPWDLLNRIGGQTTFSGQMIGGWDNVQESLPLTCEACPRHEIWIRRPVYLATEAMSPEDLTSILNDPPKALASPSRLKRIGKRLTRSTKKCPDCPAMVMVNELSFVEDLAELLGTRLPMEEEWETAAAGTGTGLFIGDCPQNGDNSVEICEHPFGLIGLGETLEFTASPWRLYSEKLESTTGAVAIRGLTPWIRFRSSDVLFSRNFNGIAAVRFAIDPPILRTQDESQNN